MTRALLTYTTIFSISFPGSAVQKDGNSRVTGVSGRYKTLVEKQSRHWGTKVPKIVYNPRNIRFRTINQWLDRSWSQRYYLYIGI